MWVRRGLVLVVLVLVTGLEGKLCDDAGWQVRRCGERYQAAAGRRTRPLRSSIDQDVTCLRSDRSSNGDADVYECDVWPAVFE